MTAANFARSFLDLEEEADIVPILFALVWKDQRSNMLLEHSVSDRKIYCYTILVTVVVNV